MNETKPFWQSKTMWGGVIALVAGIAGVFGVAVGADAQAGITEAVTAIAGGVGGLIAVYGRIKADRKLK